MKTSSLLSLTFLVLTGLLAPLTTGSAGVASESEASAAKTDELRKEVEDLRKKLEQLERRLKELEENGAGKKWSYPTPPNKPPGGPLPDLDLPNRPDSAKPKIWRRGEWNGWEYFIIPLNESSAESRP